MPAPTPPASRRPILIQTGALGLGCLLAFFALRSLPVQECRFMHYGDQINAQGVLEACGTEETSFFDLSTLRYPITFDLKSEGPWVAGTASTLDFTLTTSTGRSLEWEQFAISHTRRLHLLVVNSSLDDYQHLHPEPAPQGDPRHFRVAFTPHRAGQYRIYLDCIPLITNRRTLLGKHLDGVLPPTPDTRWISQPPEERLTCIRNDLAAEVMLAPSLREGQESELRLVLRHSSALPLTFEPVMGAFAHLVLFDTEGRGFAHLHPRNPRMEDQDPQSPDLRFAFRPDRVGFYRLWAQLQIQGHEQFFDFWLKVN